MSLHARSTPEALLGMKIQHRTSTLTSVFIALMFLLLVGMVLGLILLRPVAQEPPEISIQCGPPVEPDPDPPRAPVHLERRPQPPSGVQARVIATTALSPVSIPVLDDHRAEPALTFGDAADFGSGWEPGMEGTRPGGGGFGSSDRASGGLEGFLYDLKQDGMGAPLPYRPGVLADFAGPVIGLQRQRFSDSSLSGFFRSPQPLYLSHVAIPQTSAARGPELFGAKDLIQPSGWLAHYRGKVRVPESGSYRFSGVGDDYLVVCVDGKARLFGALADLNEAVRGRWDGSKPPGDFRAPYKNRPIVYGDWIQLREGQQIDIDITLGERPGGEVWFFLCIEKRGASYRKDDQGRPVLPLFTTVPFSPEETARLRKEFNGFEFDFDQVPVFRTTVVHPHDAPRIGNGFR